MKTLGLIGGMSWESTLVYYQLLNRMTRERLGGMHSAPLILWSVDFAPIAVMQTEGKWDEAAAILVEAGRRRLQVGRQDAGAAARTSDTPSRPGPLWRRWSGHAPGPSRAG